jgi:predicted metal-dependent hydrolase
MNHEPAPPLLVGFVADLMFTTRIESVAGRLGYAVRWVEQAADIGEVDPTAPPEKPGERLHGREGQLFEKITRWRPALLIFDLNNQAIPWRAWIPALKSSPATRRLPILCFGPHEDVEAMTRARAVGADVVVGRSRFTAALPELIQKHGRVPDYDALQDTCAEPLSELAIKGIELYNQGAYFDAHEELEHAWMADAGPGRDLYRGILQVAVAYLQIERGNYRGAVKMFLRVRQWLDPLPDVCRGVDVAGLRDNARAVHEALLALGPERLAELDRNLIQPVRYTV